MSRLLDLFCGAGGAARGYELAGFEIVGVDIKRQPHYPYPFVQGDALEYLAAHGHEFDAIHASPPCQGYSRMRHLPWLAGREWPKLIGVTRDALQATGKPWVIENVMGAQMQAGWLCGAMFGRPYYRHRAFDTSFPWLAPAHPRHTKVVRAGRMLYGRTDVTSRLMADELEWMTGKERRQAIPPTFTEFLGQLIKRGGLATLPFYEQTTA